MKAIIIARVSTEEQKEAGNSLPAQIHRLKRYCENKGFNIISEYSFDESAYKTKRDDFDKILSFIDEQKEKVVVCFDKVDRFTRNIFDKRVNILYEKATKSEIELHFISDGLIINDQKSATEKFQFNIGLSLAGYYSDAISDNVKRAQEQMLRTGSYPAQPPYGFKRTPISKDKTEIVIDEYKSKIVQKAYEWYATGAFSMDTLRVKLKEEHGIGWSHGFTDKVLKDHFYYGIMTWKQKAYKHKYTPIISKQLFEQVQSIKLSFNKKRYKYAGKPYIYRGLLRCGQCGLAITPEKHKGHVYYHCTQYNGKHNAKWLTEENITEQIGSIFKRLQLPSQTVEQIIEALKTTHESKIDFREKQQAEYEKQRDLNAKRQEKLFMDRLDGRITDDEYDKYWQQFRDQIAETDTKISMLQEAEDNYYITSKYILELANKAYELFKSSEVEERRQLIKLVLQNLRVEEDKVLYDAVKPFDTLLKYSDYQSGLPD
ncbi:MAG: recombinase family protein [bacterium]|nr:recombinase family protein [bacterium]